MTVHGADRAVLERLLGGEPMAWFRSRVRGRIRTAQRGRADRLAVPSGRGAGQSPAPVPDRGEPLTGVVLLQAPSPAQREAAIRLIGRPKRAGTALRIELADVEEMLRRGPWPAGLADAVQTLTGPVIDHAAERDRENAGWAAAQAGLTGPAQRFPGLDKWWESWCATGGLKRAARAEANRLGIESGPEVGAGLVEQVAAMLAALPASAEPLAVLARRLAGDAHGLDENRPLGRLAGTVVAAAFGVGDTREGAASVRDAWAAAGVVRSTVASMVLAVGVPGRQATGIHQDAGRPGVPEDEGLGSWGDNEPRSLLEATSSALEAMRAGRAPLLLTLDQVRSGGVAPLLPGSRVHVCENPTVVEVVAARWAEREVPDGAAWEGATGGNDAPAQSPGDTAPVLVCTWGQASTAVVELLEILTSAGATCHYHGDFDWPGLRIAAALHARVPWQPWRFSAADYRAAARGEGSSRRLMGASAEAPWDTGLVPEMLARGLAVEEEAVVDQLAQDLLGT